MWSFRAGSHMLQRPISLDDAIFIKNLALEGQTIRFLYRYAGFKHPADTIFG